MYSGLSVGSARSQARSIHLSLRCCGPDRNPKNQNLLLYVMRLAATFATTHTVGAGTINPEGLDGKEKKTRIDDLSMIYLVGDH